MGGQTTLDLSLLENQSAFKRGKAVMLKFSGADRIQKLMDMMEGRKKKSPTKWAEELGVPVECIPDLMKKMETGDYKIRGRYHGKSSRSR